MEIVRPAPFHVSPVPSSFFASSTLVIRKRPIPRELHNAVPSPRHPSTPSVAHSPSLRSSTCPLQIQGQGIRSPEFMTTAHSLQTPPPSADSQDADGLAKLVSIWNPNMIIQPTKLVEAPRVPRWDMENDSEVLLQRQVRLLSSSQRLDKTLKN